MKPRIFSWRAVLAPLSCSALLVWGALARGDAPTATIRVSTATAGSSLGHLVEGVLTFRDRDYLLKLHGVTGPTQSSGSVYGLTRPRDIEGYFKPFGDGLRNSQGVMLRFDPPLPLGPDGLEVEVAGGLQQKGISRGAPGAGVEQ
ncbi:MAG TPA: hypothetical protein VEN47_11750 [Myxococcota bacterium]|nr:hypothetical protein [Myxococcota bacterium]